MTQRDRGAVRRRHPESHPTHHVLSHIEHGVAVWSLDYFDRLDFFNRQHRRPSRSHQLCLGRVEQRYVLPVLVIVSSVAPSGAFQTRIVSLAVVDIGRQNGAGRRLPLLVSTDDFLFAILICNDQLRQQSQLRSVGIAVVPPCHVSPEPAITEQSAQAVLSRFQLRGDIIGLVLITKIIGGPSRREVLVANPLAVQLQLV